MKRAFALLLGLALLLTGCGKAEAASTEFFAMDTYMSLRAYGADAATLADCKALVEALEAELSVTAEDSALSRLNAEGTARFSPDAAALLARGLELCALSGGALDLTVYPVLRAWGFTTGEYRVPEQEELSALLNDVNWKQVRSEPDGTVSLPSGAALDLGAVAKGWTGDRLCALLRERGVESALLDLGGNIQALGGKPDGSDWRVGLRDPAGDGLLGTLSVRDAAVVTSGGYERYFTDEAGRVWWHILDPKTGYPARSGLISATVVGPVGVDCDGLSTALFVLGAERAAALWREQGGFELALVTEDGRLLLTPSLAERFRPAEGLSYAVEVIPDA